MFRFAAGHPGAAAGAHAVPAPLRERDRRRGRTRCAGCAIPGSGKARRRGARRPARTLARLCTMRCARPHPLRSAARLRPLRRQGYHGRMGIHELMLADDVVRRLIRHRDDAGAAVAAALAAGMKTLRQDGIAKVLAGRTDLAEVGRHQRMSMSDISVPPEVLGKGRRGVCRLARCAAAPPRRARLGRRQRGGAPASSYCAISPSSCRSWRACLPPRASRPPRPSICARVCRPAPAGRPRSVPRRASNAARRGLLRCASWPACSTS